MNITASNNCNTGLPTWLSGKESICLPKRRCWFDPWVGKIQWRRKWQPTTLFLPGKYRGTWGATVHRVEESNTT